MSNVIDLSRERAARRRDHDCEEHVEVVEFEKRCPGCPDGTWRAADFFCGVCGDWLQAAGHVHPLPDGDTWLARSGVLQDGPREP